MRTNAVSAVHSQLFCTQPFRPLPFSRRKLLFAVIAVLLNTNVQLQAGLAASLLISAYVLQQRCSPFVSASSLSKHLQLGVVELGQRLSKRTATTTKGSAGVATTKVRSRKGTAAEVGQGRGRVDTQAGADAAGAAGAQESSRVPTTPAPAGESRPGHGLAMAARVAHAATPPTQASFARVAMRVLGLAINYNHLVSALWSIAVYFSHLFFFLLRLSSSCFVRVHANQDAHNFGQG